MGLDVKHDVDVRVDVHLWMPEGEVRALLAAIDATAAREVGVVATQADRDMTSFRQVLVNALESADDAVGRTRLP